MKNNKRQTSKWEEELKRNFYDTDGDLCPEDADFRSVRDFISTLLASQREEVLEEVDDAIAELLRTSEVGSAKHECQQEGYEYGLEDAIAVLRKIKQEKA